MFKLALIQLAVSSNKQVNWRRATELIEKAAQHGAKLICLPECWNSPYGVQHFAEYAESVPGESTTVLADAARRHRVWLIGGSLPERSADGRLFNTCTVFNPDGELTARFSKLHLFDIDIPGKITFKESAAMSAGSSLCEVDTGFAKLGIGICYDVRFAELSLLYRARGANLLIFPGAFNMTTGPAHWTLLARARSIDNQCYVAMCSPARDTSASYVAYGHSIIVSPSGEVLQQADEKEDIVYADFDPQLVTDFRNQLPYGYQKRNDIYELVAK